MNKFGNTEVWGDLYINGEKVKDVATTGSYDDLTDKPGNATFGQGIGECTTATATTAKEVTLSGYELVTGGIVVVKFTNSVPASATLNVNGKGAKAIYVNGSAITTDIIGAGDTVTFIYDGTNYNYISSDKLTSLRNGSGTYSIVSADSTATGGRAVALGQNNVASGYASVAVGQSNTASGSISHATGQGSEAQGDYSHTEGQGTKAKHKACSTLGQYNLVDPSTASASSRGTYVEIVGNGTDANNRSNARTLDWQGNEVLAGSMTISKDKEIYYDSINQCIRINFN